MTMETRFDARCRLAVRILTAVASGMPEREVADQCGASHGAVQRCRRAAIAGDMAGWLWRRGQPPHTLEVPEAVHQAADLVRAKWPSRHVSISRPAIRAAVRTNIARARCSKPAKNETPPGRRWHSSLAEPTWVHLSISNAVRDHAREMNARCRA